MYHSGAPGSTNETEDVFEMKDEERFLFKTVHDLLHSQKESGISDLMYGYTQDMSLIPSMIIENVYTALDSKASVDALHNIASDISLGDVASKHMFSNNEYELSEYYGYTSVVGPCVEIRKEPMINEHHHNLRFPSSLGKNAMLYNNANAYKKFCYASGIPRDPDQFACLRGKILNLLDSKNEEDFTEGLKLMCSYKLYPDHLIQVLKVKMFSSEEYKHVNKAKTKEKIKKEFPEIWFEMYGVYPI